MKSTNWVIFTLSCKSRKKIQRLKFQKVGTVAEYQPKTKNN